MIREVTFALTKSARLVSGNEIRNAPGMVNHRRATAQHKAIASQLGSAFPRCRLFLADGRPNKFTITITRISFGALDDHDRQASFKWAIDAVAMWIDGITDRKKAGQNDSAERFTWHCLQQIGPRGHYGITIKIEDLDDLPDVRKIIGEAPAILGAPTDRRPARPAIFAGAKPEQRSLIFKRCWVALPWQQDPASPVYKLVEADKLARLLETPATISVINPRTRQPIQLYRHAHRDPSIGGEVWLYTEEAPVVTHLPGGAFAVDGVPVTNPIPRRKTG